MLFELSNSQGISPQHIAEILDCLGQLAEKGKITGFVWVPVLDALLFYLLTHSLLTTSDISMSLRGILRLDRSKNLNGYVDDLQIRTLQQTANVDLLNEPSCHKLMVLLSKSKRIPKRALINDVSIDSKAPEQGLKKRIRPNLTVIVGDSGRETNAFGVDKQHAEQSDESSEREMSLTAQHDMRPAASLHRPAVSSQTKRPTAWNEALKNCIFRAIASKKMGELERILHVNALTPKSSASRSFSGRFFPVGKKNSPSQSISPSNGLKTESYQQVQAKLLVDSFLSKTSREALIPLIEQSEAQYFGLILHACSFSARYDFAKSGALHPIILKLCRAQLVLFVDIVITLGLYRDHVALLNLVHALDIRKNRYATPDESPQIQALQQILLERAITYHQTRGHCHVVSRLMEYATIPANRGKSTGNTSAIAEELNDDMDVMPEHVRAFLNASALPAAVFEETSFLMSNGELNMDHLYTAEAMNILLRLYTNTAQLGGVAVLGAVDMTRGCVGNTFADSFQAYLTAYPLTEGEQRTLLVPIHLNQHWVGVRLDIQLNEIGEITFYDSLHSPERQQQLMRVIKPLIEGAVHKACRERIVPCLQQSDGTSCGEYLIENMYSDLTFFRYSSERIGLAETLRQAHIEKIKNGNPAYYAKQQRLAGEGDEYSRSGGLRGLSFKVCK